MYTVVGALLHMFLVASLICFLSIVVTTFFERFSVVFKCSKTTWASFLATLLSKKFYDFINHFEKISIYVSLFGGP